uniref:hemerythrin domain-containing protein n=1 Tax=Herbidospora sakaeratensis TaxID=564415 RepID=UPI000780A764|nr:hemerythrin domain-containing protein [Herbidospora sakaeratensis]
MAATTTEPPQVLRPEGSVSRVIAADPVHLYDWVADVTRTPEWSPETRRCDWLGDERGVGARFTGLNVYGLWRWTRECEVVAADHGRAFAFRTVPAGKITDSTVWSYRFEPVEGGTRVTHGYEMVRRLTRGQQRAAAWMMPRHRDRRPDMARSLDRMADLAEGRANARQPLLGQAHTAEGPIPLGSMYVMHHAFRRDLRDLSRAVPATPLTDHEAWAALARRWTAFAATLHHHHTIEDTAIWPRVRARADVAATMAAMEAEHDLIDPLLATCAEGFHGMTLIPDARTRDTLTADVARFRDLLEEHLAHEETEALPLIQRHLSLAAWQDSEKAAQAEFKLADLGFTLPWTALEVPPDTFRAALADAGPMLRLLLALTRGRFLREHRAAFRWAS